MSAGLHGFFDIQRSTSPAPPSSPTVTNPPPTHQKTKTHARQAPSVIELDSITFGKQYNGPASGPQTPGAQTPMETVIPMTPNELEMSRPPSRKGDEAVGVVQSWNNPPMNKWRIASCCLIYFANGIFDSGMSLFLSIEFLNFVSNDTLRIIADHS
jgi:hypothetical protein